MEKQGSRVLVNGVRITQAQIDSEVQYHPAPDLFTAQEAAVRALIVKELLLQRAAKIGIGESSSLPEQLIEKLLLQEIRTPEPDEASCRRYYDSNRKRFMTMPLFEVSHILFLAPPDDEKARTAALQSAQEVLRHVRAHPDDFAQQAERMSACSSAKTGGHLGQVSRGQTLPAFEAALQMMTEGEISSVPVATEVGFHIIKLHHRADGKELPFEAVRGWIEKYLKDQSWQHAVRQYIQLLAGEAHIVGYKMPSAESPLVQ